jgi:hypothetical protein
MKDPPMLYAATAPFWKPTTTMLWSGATLMAHGVPKAVSRVLTSGVLKKGFENWANETDKVRQRRRMVRLNFAIRINIKYYN